MDADDRSLTTRIANAYCDSLANGWSGRRLYGQLVAAGFDAEVEVLPAPPSPEVARTVLLPALYEAGRAAGVDEAQLDRWLAEQHARAESGRFFLSFTFFLVSGTRR